MNLAESMRRVSPAGKRRVWPAFRSSDVWFEGSGGEPSGLSARNNLPEFAGHNSPPARNGAHNRHTGRRGDQDLSGFEKGVIDLACQWPRKGKRTPTPS